MFGTFTWRGITFTIRRTEDGWQYRDQAHFGGPWSSVAMTMNNAGIDLNFRRSLQYAMQQLVRNSVEIYEVPPGGLWVALAGTGHEVCEHPTEEGLRAECARRGIQLAN